MFIRDFLYTIKILMRAKVSIFWTLVFPILLATFMYMAFGNIYEQDEMFRNIKVAVVTEDESINGLNYMLDALSDGDDALLSVTRMSESNAEKALADEEVEGIIYTDDVRLTVAESSVNASILETVLSEYKQYEHALKDIYKEGTEPKGGWLLMASDSNSICLGLHAGMICRTLWKNSQNRDHIIQRRPALRAARMCITIISMPYLP